MGARASPSGSAKDSLQAFKRAVGNQDEVTFVRRFLVGDAFRLIDRELVNDRGRYRGWLGAKARTKLSAHRVALIVVVWITSGSN